MTAAAPPPLASITKNSTEEIRVTRSDFKGYDLVDVRVYGRFTMAGAFMPTKRGLSVQVDQLPALIKALQTAQAAITGGHG